MRLSDGKGGSLAEAKYGGLLRIDNVVYGIQGFFYKSDLFNLRTLPGYEVILHR